MNGSGYRESSARLTIALFDHTVLHAFRSVDRQTTQNTDRICYATVKWRTRREHYDTAYVGAAWHTIPTDKGCHVSRFPDYA